MQCRYPGQLPRQHDTSLLHRRRICHGVLQCRWFDCLFEWGLRWLQFEFGAQMRHDNIAKHLLDKWSVGRLRLSRGNAHLRWHAGKVCAVFSRLGLGMQQLDDAAFVHEQHASRPGVRDGTDLRPGGRCL